MNKSKTYKCLIIDDEPIAGAIIAEHLEHFTQFEITGIFTTAIEALHTINSRKPDLLFLDINIPGISGINFMKTLTHAPSVIFTTAYREFAADAFELNAIDYLLKPISLERFTKAISKFLALQANSASDTNHTPTTAEHITIAANNKFYNLRFNEILFIESLDNYVKIHTLKNSYVCYDKLVGLEHRLPKTMFIRIHRSYIVNINNINAFTSTYVDIGEVQLNIGRSYRTDVKERLSK
jgi:DNA-binding LytR/AlgR family response regulator